MLLPQAGFTTTQLRGVGFEAWELTAAGFSVKELKEGGYTTAAELRAAGCVVRDLKEGGARPRDSNRELNQQPIVKAVSTESRTFESRPDRLPRGPAAQGRLLSGGSRRGGLPLQGAKGGE